MSSYATTGPVRIDNIDSKGNHIANGCIPRRTEVERLAVALDQLEKVLAEHAEQIEPILRPADLQASGDEIRPPSPPESRLAMLVNRVNYISIRFGRLTERVEA